MSRQPIGAALRRVALHARKVLDRQATAAIAAFLASCADAAGGYRGRGPAADLYYTSFGILAGEVVGARPDRRRLTAFLERHSPAELDLPHLAALCQGQRLLHPLHLPRACRAACRLALQRFRSRDGGFAETPGAASATAYGLYLALLCSEALGDGVTDAALAHAAAEGRLAAALPVTAAPGLPTGGAVSTLAAGALSVQALGGRLPAAAVQEALHACRAPDGGFLAHPRAVESDLLSTAVAAFALRRLGAPLSGSAAGATARYVQGLWTEAGGFRGAAADPLADVEYTFYALLALGALEA